jgi:hypothetical protein
MNLHYLSGWFKKHLKVERLGEKKEELHKDY